LGNKKKQLDGAHLFYFFLFTLGQNAQTQKGREILCPYKVFFSFRMGLAAQKSSSATVGL